MKRVALAALSLLLLTGCAGITAGDVIAKGYEPEHEYWVNVKVGENCHTTSQGTRTCTPINQMQHRVDDEDWWIKIQYCESSNKCKTNKVYVSEAKHESLGIGDYYSQEER